MSIHKVASSPMLNPVAVVGQHFELLAGGDIEATFYGVNDEWSETLSLTVGDSLNFIKPFARVEVQSDYQYLIEFYAGFVEMQRNRMDFLAVGATSLRSGREDIPKAEVLLVGNDRSRRAVTIKALSGTVYLGSKGNINDKFPLSAGEQIRLETSAAVFAEANPAHGLDTVDVRFTEEIN